MTKTTGVLTNVEVSIATAVLSTMVAGEKPVVVTTSNLNASFVRSIATDMGAESSNVQMSGFCDLTPVGTPCSNTTVVSMSVIQTANSRYGGASNANAVNGSQSVSVDFFNAQNQPWPISEPQKPLVIYIPRLPSIIAKTVATNVTNHTTLPRSNLIYHVFTRPVVNQSLSIVIKPLGPITGVFSVYVRMGGRPNAVTNNYDYFQNIPRNASGMTQVLFHIDF
jgi:hypothetical protein